MAFNISKKDKALQKLNRKLTALREKLLRKGVSPRENYGERELMHFKDMMKKTFNTYNVNPYIDEKAKTLVKRFERLQEDIIDFDFPRR